MDGIEPLIFHIDLELFSKLDGDIGKNVIAQLVVHQLVPKRHVSPEADVCGVVTYISDVKGIMKGHIGNQSVYDVRIGQIEDFLYHGQAQHYGNVFAWPAIVGAEQLFDPPCRQNRKHYIAKNTAPIIF
jgi:hypothetical protein